MKKEDEINSQKAKRDPRVWESLCKMKAGKNVKYL